MEIPAYYARLDVTVKSLDIPADYDPDVYVKVRIGPISFQTTRRKLNNNQWGDKFEFRINSHAHLFYTLQVDVYEYRMILSSHHVGRAEMRLAKLDVIPVTTTTCQWYNLRHRKNCYIHLNELKIRDPALDQEITGRIELELCFKPSINVAPELRFDTNLDDVSVITLTSLPMSPEEEPPVINDEELTKSMQVYHHNRIYERAVLTESAESRALAQPEIVSLFKRILGYMVSNQEYIAIRNFLDMAVAWGQGIEVGNMALFVGFVLLQRYYKNIPMDYGNNLVLKKNDLEIPRIIYKYTMATMGWRGLNFFGKGQGYINDSFRSEADLKSVMNFLKLTKSDLLIFEIGENRIFRPNFFVAIDRGLSAIVLSIRGTMSLSDSITDFACEYINYRGGMVHSGFFEAARWFIENIGPQLLIFAREYGMENIYITGHSLGGSTSVLTTMLLVDQLKKERHWPVTADKKKLNIHCYAYAAAPVATRALCEEYTDFIDVFIYGDDIVPRMSYGSLIDFQIMMVYAAEIGSTYQVLKGGIDETVFQKVHQCRIAMRSQQPPMNLKLYIPGRIHHILKLSAPNDQKLVVIDTTTCDRFQDGHVTRKMLNHHMPGKYEKALNEAYELLLEDEVDQMEHPDRSPTFLEDAVKLAISKPSSPADSASTADM